MLINKISFPYPVLNNADDVNGEFGFNFDVELSPETIILTVKINLDNDSFKKLLKEKKVAFCLEVHNSQAFFRESYVFEDYDKKFTLLSKNLRGKVDVYLYIIAIDNIKDYSLSEDEMRVVEYLKGCRSASDDKLGEIGIESWLLRSMERHGLVKELTT